MSSETWNISLLARIHKIIIIRILFAREKGTLRSTIVFFFSFNSKFENHRQLEISIDGIETNKRMKSSLKDMNRRMHNFQVT